MCFCVYLLCAHKNLCVHFRKRLRRHWSVSISSMYTSKCLYGRTNHCTADVPAAESTPLWATCCHHYLERALAQPPALNMGWRHCALWGLLTLQLVVPVLSDHHGVCTNTQMTVHLFECAYLCVNVCFLWLSLMLFVDRYWAKFRHLVSKPMSSRTLVHK